MVQLRQLAGEDGKQVPFTILFSIFERAYLLYDSGSIREEQWLGWHDYITDFCSTPSCQKHWATLGDTYDRQFKEYMARRLAGIPEPEKRHWFCALLRNLFQTQ